MDRRIIVRLGRGEEREPRPGKRTDPERAYPIEIGARKERRIATYLRTRGETGTIALVSDKHLEGEASRLAEAIATQGLKVTRFLLAPGETNKTLGVLQQLQNAFLAAGLDRSSLVVALGGGMVGDLAGFAAATYMRGLPWIYVPTTLLAIVDAAIGGKVAVNLPAAKNACGTFHHPEYVFGDVAHLATLPERQRRSGAVEVVKYAMIADAELFDRLEQEIEAFLALQPDSLLPIVARCCEIKAEIVMQDERERGLRRILNYGHTIGHAIETLTGYQNYLHGEAVALGMRVEGVLATELAGLSTKELERQECLLERLLPDLSLPDLSSEALIETLKCDKKSYRGSVMFALPTAIGRMWVGEGDFRIGVSPDAILAAYETVSRAR